MEFADLGYSAEQIDLLDVAANFCREKSPMDHVRKLMDSAAGYDEGVWAEIAALGWTAIGIPPEFGGVGLSLAEMVPVAEQMGRRMMPSPFAASALAAQALIAGAHDAQKAAWLPKLAAGMPASIALFEPHGDWDLTHIEARAVDNGANGANGEIRLTGEKQFVQWGHAAGLIIVSVLLNGSPALLLITPADLPAGALRREAIVDETKRSAALTLDGIILPGTALLDQGRAAATLQHIERAALLLQSAEICGGTQQIIDYTAAYLQTRKQFGNVIGGYQALKHPLVNAYAAYEKARSLLYSAAHNFADQGANNGDRGEIAVRMAKAAADQSYSYAADRAIQFHGGFGFTDDCDAGLHRRAAIFHASQYGDAAWQRRKLVQLLL